MLNDETRQVRSIAYQIASQVGFDFQAAATFSLSRHSFQLDFCKLPLPSHAVEVPSCARGSFMRLGINVAPKLHRTRTKRFTPTYLRDKHSRARCGKLAPWRQSYPVIFLSREKGSSAFTVSPTPTIFRSLRKAFLLVEPVRCCLGREAGACNTSCYVPCILA